MLLNEGGNRFNGRGNPHDRATVHRSTAAAIKKAGLSDRFVNAGSQWKDTQGDSDIFWEHPESKENVRARMAPHFEREADSYLIPAIDEKGAPTGSHIQLDTMFPSNPTLAKNTIVHNTPTAHSGGTYHRVLSDLVRTADPNLQWSPTVGIRRRDDGKTHTGDYGEIVKHFLGPNGDPKNFDTVEGLQRHFADKPERLGVIQNVLDDVKRVKGESIIKSFKGFLIVEARVNAMDHLAAAGPEHSREIQARVAELSEYTAAGKVPPHIAAPKYDGSAGLVASGGKIALAIKPDRTFGSHQEIDDAYPEDRADLRLGLKHGLDYAKSIPSDHTHKLDVAGPGKLVLHTVNGEAATEAKSTESTQVGLAAYGEPKVRIDQLGSQASQLSRLAAKLPDHANQVDPETHALVTPVAVRAALEGKFKLPTRTSDPSLHSQFSSYVESNPVTKGGNAVFSKKQLTAIKAADPEKVKSSVHYVHALDSVGKALNNLTGNFEEPSGGKFREGTVLRLNNGATFKATTDEFRAR